MDAELPFRFIDEAVEVIFDRPPLLEKSPPCPDGFIWRDETFRVARMLAQWQDFRRRGRMERNMRPAHASRAALHGSWGVGRFYFRVEMTGGRVFELYYDRAPANAGERKGSWFLYGERQIN
ncbi:MAG: hypothetical protein GYA17_16990 [Chloroflexi bacterium]|jgi:hypothetical protein|nr:DUF6504 family protein [Anaerolineaceae bacterium]NMB90056.1 hypothetical protein [Chloroflexota bacterium]